MEKENLSQIDRVRSMPKVDLHVHLGGCFAHSDIRELAQKYHPDIAEEQFRDIFSFRDFAGFSNAWKFKNSLVSTYQDFSFLMDGVVDYVKRENIVYWEPALALFEFAPLDPAKLLDIADSKLKNSGAHHSFLMDLVRGDGAESLRAQYDFYNSLAKDYPIRGVGLSGNEEKHGLSKDLIPIFAKAKADGYGITIHASESGNLANVKSAVEDFGADRIGHANFMNLCLDRPLVDRIVRSEIHLEFVPSSLGRWNRHGHQQVAREIHDYLHAGVLNRMYGAEIPHYDFSIGSDDPGMFGESFSKVLADLNLRDKDYDHIMHVANDASFAPPEVKESVSLALCGSPKVDISKLMSVYGLSKNNR